MVWAALLIGLGSGALLLVGVLRGTGIGTRIREPLARVPSLRGRRREESCERAVEPAQLEGPLRMFNELRDELLLHVVRAKSPPGEPADSDPVFDESLEAFRKASERFVEKARSEIQH